MKIKNIINSVENFHIILTPEYYLMYLLVLSLIFLYGQYRCSNKNFKDPLEKKINISELEVDGWSFTHVMFFMLMGYLFPNTFIQTMTMGVLWELFEHIYGKQRPGWLGGYGGKCNNMATDRDDGNWWYGKWSDIGCNAFGFLVGKYLSNEY